ncbi:MAG TPA: M28 family peptidase [Ignavibacteria bacterium]|nr:M28 family peptidase [Ignavibacteria bacterium]
MKHILSLFFLLTLLYLLPGIVSPQIIHNQKIDSIINLVSVQSISRMCKELSGDTTVNIGGIPQLIFSRAWISPGNVKASQYIYEKFQSYGYNPRYQRNDSICVNVYVEKTGTKYPNKKYVICAHYDNILWPVLPGMNDTVHGADDDASGVCAVLEAARLMKNFNTDYTVIFVALDEEEPLPYLLGSTGFADSCYFRGDSILGVLDIDMLGYNTCGSFAEVFTDTNSYGLYNCIAGCNQSYNTGFIFSPRIRSLIPENKGFDSWAFWNRGYQSVCSIESYRCFNNYVHTKNESFDKFNVPYFYRYVKCNIATILTLALDCNVMMNHLPLTNTSESSPRIAKVYIKSPFRMASGGNAPRLHYKVNTGVYNYVNAVSIQQDTFKFIIPGSPLGSKVYYYFSLQDSAGSVCVTLPNGGSGINPPGTTPPSDIFSYEIYSNLNQCSNTLPKPINDLTYTLDTIPVNQNSKFINNVKVNLTINHPNDGDLIIQLRGANSMLTLSQNNGTGGANYINTTFDDSASTPITQGTPPFTGSYRPQNALSSFNNKPADGLWVLRVFDTKVGDVGTLINWCIIMQLKNSVSVNEQNIPVKYELLQNYPNPFNPTTRIRFNIMDTRFVELKVYDILGKEVAVLINEKLKPGEYDAIFNGGQLAAGVYFYKLTAGNFSEVKKMVLIK